MPERNFKKENRVIDTGSGINPLGPSKKVKASIRKAIKLIGATVELPYGLKKLLSSKFGIPADSTLFANSIEDLVHMILLALIPGKVLVAGPALGIYESACLEAGAEVRFFSARKENGFMLLPDELAGEMDGAELIFISNPNRITGKLTPQAELIKLLKLVEERNITLVVDESLIDFTEYSGLMANAPGHSSLIVLKTTAFYYGLAGLELAYAIASPDVIRKLRDKNRCTLNILAETAAVTAMKDKGFADLARAFIAQEKAVLFRSASKIPDLEFYPSDSNTFLISPGNAADKLIAAMALGGFSLRVCEMGEPAEKFFSFSLMDHDKNKKFGRILKETLHRQE